jgi:hypothetical protein
MSTKALKSKIVELEEQENALLFNTNSLDAESLECNNHLNTQH